jgi:hypothetical protein
MPRDPETSLKKADDYRATLHNSALAHIEDASVSAFRAPPSGYETHHARLAAGAESMCLLLAYPDAADFYKSIGMEPFADAFVFGRDR